MQNLSANAYPFNIAATKPGGAVTRVANQHSETPSSDAAYDDESLLIAVGNSQDRQAFNLLFKHYSGKIFGLGMKLTHNEQLSKELVQEAMLAIWQKAPLYNVDKGSVQTWIFTLARNRCFDLLRKMKRQSETISADDIWPTLSDTELSPDLETEYSTSVQTRQIRTYYHQLPPAQRDIIEHVFLQEKTHQEAALALNIPLGTVKSRLRLALNKLRQLAEAAP